MSEEVDAYFNNLKKWQNELLKLREIILSCDLTEQLKWRNPCYMHQQKNILLFGGFKDNCVISFLNGALLQDKHKLLKSPGENSQSAKVIRFTSLHEIIDLQEVIKAYIFEAIAIESLGIKIPLTASKNIELIGELQQFFATNKAFEKCFMALTPGRQRAYNMHFAGAKLAATRIARIEKCIPKIMIGKGPNDCTCGLSKRMPNCDGSHKFLKQL
jgi:uncharacterized protein YdeI (YjbR/CyaY-like superfamily)